MNVESEIHASYMDRVKEIRQKNNMDMEIKKSKEAQAKALEAMKADKTGVASVNSDETAEVASSDGEVVNPPEVNTEHADKAIEEGSMQLKETAGRVSMESTLVQAHRTPAIDDQALESFDAKSMDIRSIIKCDDFEASLDKESVPIRDSLEPDFGVMYSEDKHGGGRENCIKEGKSYRDKPGRTMALDELEKTQEQEKVSKMKIMGGGDGTPPPELMLGTRVTSVRS